jgi:hypothetical protein
MDGIDVLRSQALQKRNAAIAVARRQYAADLKEITVLKNKLGLKPVGRPRKFIASDYAGLKATTVAREVLLEGKPMSMVELTLEVQRRGCRSLDDPRAVAHAIRSGLHNYPRQFRKDEKGRWACQQRD